MIMIEWLSAPWPWYFSGMMISLLMWLMLYFGKTFAFSSNFRTLCAMCGLGAVSSYFRYDWKSQIWNVIFLLGAIAGGWLSSAYWMGSGIPEVSEHFISDLLAMGFSAPTSMQPSELYDPQHAFSLKGFLILLLGGIMVGFGARYAGGCTSGHAISGLSNLQWPSLLAVLGFFAGGLFMTYVVFPYLFSK
jgi:uncharacterized membrane protein YedE/YeeE